MQAAGHRLSSWVLASPQPQAGVGAAPRCCAGCRFAPWQGSLPFSRDLGAADPAQTADGARQIPVVAVAGRPLPQSNVIVINHPLNTARGVHAQHNLHPAVPRVTDPQAGARGPVGPLGTTQQPPRHVDMGP